MTPVIIAQACALNAKEDYSRCHVVDYRSLLCLRVWIFPFTSVERPQAPALISFVRLSLLCSTSACPQKPTYGWTLLVLLGCGGGGEPQLLSDVNAAQTLCVCGHSPSDRSNQLMGYLTLCWALPQLFHGVAEPCDRCYSPAEEPIDPREDREQEQMSSVINNAS